MGRDDPGYDVANLDVAWANGPKAKALQMDHPAMWCNFWCAYQSVFSESWRRGKRASLKESWLSALPVGYNDTLRALIKVKLLDRSGRLPQDVYDERVAPGLARIVGARRAVKPGTPPAPRGERRRPATPSDDASGDGRQRGGGPRSLKELMKEAGYAPEDHDPIK